TCGVLALLGPYVATIGRLSNKNTIKLMQGDPNANWQALPHAARGAEATPLAGAARTPLAVWWFEPSDHGKSHALWGLTALLRETVQSLHYGVAVLALLGLAWFHPRPRGLLGAWLLAALITGHALIVWWMAAKIGYFSERHTLFFVFAACYPAAAALIWLRRRYGTGVACTVVAGLFAAAMPALAKPLHANRAGHRAAGRWLAAHATPADPIIDPFHLAEFYACDPPPRLMPNPAPPPY